MKVGESGIGQPWFRREKRRLRLPAIIAVIDFSHRAQRQCEKMRSTPCLRSRYLSCAATSSQTLMPSGFFIEDRDSIFWTSPITMASSLFTSLVERVEKLVCALIRIMIRALRFIDWLKETNVAGNSAARSMFVLSCSSRCCGIRSFSRYKNGALSGAGYLRDESLRQ